MSNIQKRLDSLKPYVFSIRFLEGVAVLDVLLKAGWKIPSSDTVQKLKDETDDNYYMFFSSKEGIGVDELFDYVETIIQYNIENEKKVELLRTKVEELKVLFKKNSLVQLMNLKFTLNNNIENEITMDDIHNNTNENLEKDIQSNNLINKSDVEINNVVESEIKKPIVIETKEQLKQIFEEKPMFKENMTEEEREEEEAIARAKAFRELKDKQKLDGVNSVKKSNKVELPPRDKINQTSQNLTCDCGDDFDKICGVCAERKSL